jgi:DNA-binding PadR family transcriptional regulator
MVYGLLENLVSMGYIEERARTTAYDRTMYTYALTDDGLKLSSEVRKREPEKYAAISQVVERCEKIVNNNISVLSWAAKVYFLLSKKGEEISPEEAVRASRRFGWRLKDKEVNSGARLLLGLGLVRKSKS